MAAPKLGAQNFIDKNREIDPSRLFRDTRSMGQKFLEDFASNRESLGIVTMVLGAACFFFPQVVLLLPFWWLFAIWWTRENPESLPLRLPIGSQIADPTDPAPGRKKFRKGRGIFYLGNDMKTGEECWISREDLLTHMLFFGTTGAGKTFTLTGVAANYLCMGGGLIYVDAKAAASLALDIHAIACGLGRDDDMLVLNFITGSEIIDARNRNRISNSMNFMSRGAASTIGDVLTSLLPGDDGGANSVFKDQALSLVRGGLPSLVDLRNAGKIALGANTMREWLFNLENIMKLSNKCKSESGKSCKIEYADLQSSIRPEAMESLNAYLGGVPGFDFNKKASEQSDKTKEQFGYAKMYWNRVMSIFADDYRHLFWADVADVDTNDVIRQRRILVGLLPALEKSPADLKSIGNIVLSALKQSAASLLPASLSGPRKLRDIPMPACPGGIVLDEYAYITTDGFAVLPAQARGLGIGLVFAGQDYPGFKRASEKEAGQTIGNTNTKVIMKIEDSTDTWQLVKEMAGDAFVSQAGGYQRNQGALGGYADNQSAGIELRSRVNLGDLKSFIEGESLVFFQNRIVRMFMFAHMTPKSGESLFNVHEFLPLPPLGQASTKFPKGTYPQDLWTMEDAAKGMQAGEVRNELSRFGLMTNLLKEWVNLQQAFDQMDNHPYKPKNTTDFLRFCIYGQQKEYAEFWPDEIDEEKRKKNKSSSGGRSAVAEIQKNTVPEEQSKVTESKSNKEEVTENDLQQIGKESGFRKATESDLSSLPEDHPMKQFERVAKSILSGESLEEDFEEEPENEIAPPKSLGQEIGDPLEELLSEDGQGEQPKPEQAKEQVVPKEIATSKNEDPFEKLEILAEKISSEKKSALSDQQRKTRVRQGEQQGSEKSAGTRTVKPSGVAAELWNHLGMSRNDTYPELPPPPPETRDASMEAQLEAHLKNLEKFIEESMSQ